MLQLKRIDSSEAPQEHQHSGDQVTKPPEPAQPQHMFLYYQGPYSWSCLSASPWKDEIFLSYLVADLGPMGTLYRKIAMSSDQPDSSQRAATKQCFLALATTFYGVGHAEESIVDGGRRIYSRALTMLNATISDSSRHGMTETLSSVVALSLHEAIAPTLTNSHTWLCHINGLEQLFAAHGPITDASDPLVKVLVEATRLIMITVTLYTRRPSLMSRPEWKAANTNQSVYDSALPYILDALAQLPTLYSERDALVSDSQTQAPGDTDGTSSPYPILGVQSLLGSSLGLLNDIRAQRTQWMDSHPNSEFPSLPSTRIYSIQPYPCRIITHFSSLHVANAFTLYNCLLILINQFIISVCRLIPTKHRDILAEELASEQVSVAAVEILKSIDYHLPFTLPASESILHGSGPRNFYLLFPMRVAFQVLSQSESLNALSQKLWLKDIFDVIKGRAGPWASNEQIFRLG
ncbi:hypothetical protein G7Y89_g3410 [Cudoniella acicularis]|uniref:Uncharacterized protein n=1 Tax=Cudoniella acicularis TaxID=354080 RepID=A0A8H4RTE2_9HELO|nr:hypothetical protein G7Y89_g3410 [Cudoniella acicularis]